MLRYSEWMNEFAYIGKGVTEGTVEEALLHFFHCGISPWIKSYGYSWNAFNDDIIAKKFLKFCYDIYRTVQSKNCSMILESPEPRHRNLPEDWDTFDLIVDVASLTDFLEKWDFRTEIVGTRFDYLIRDFCYVWIDVTSGKPGTLTQKLLDAQNEEGGTDDERDYALPEGNWDRNKNTLY